MLVRVRAGLTAVATCVAMASCAQAGDQPRSSGTIEPRITESSPMPSARPGNIACTLLSADERAALPGFAMNDVLPVRHASDTEECIWVRSVREPASAAIRVVVYSTRTWLRDAVPTLRSAIVSPDTVKSSVPKLKKALAEILSDPKAVSPGRACETYVLLATSRGTSIASGSVYYSALGAMPATYAVTCAEGIMTTAGYAELGIRPSLALNHGVLRLAEAAGERAVDALAEREGDADEGTAGDDPEEGLADEDESPSPEPSPTETDEGDPEDDGNES